MAFLNRSWKQKSEEEEEEKEESSHLLNLCCLLKENPVGQQATTAKSHFHKGTGTPEQVLMQTPSRSFPTFQTLINLPVKYKTTPGSHPQQRKSQFWGLPSLHSESLEAILLSSGGASPWKLSVSPSVLFNNLISMSRSNLLLPQCYSLTQLPNPEDMEEIASDPQQLPSPPFPPVPLLPLHEIFPVDHKEILCGTEQRRVPWVSKDQALHPQPNLQRTATPSKLLPSSEVSWEMTWNPNLQHIPDSLSASLFYPSCHLGNLTRFESPRKTKGQSENPKVSNSPRLTPSSIKTSWPELQGASLFGSHVLWETTQSENYQMVEPLILGPCQVIDPMTEPQETSHLEILPIDETRWASIGHKQNTPASESPVLAQCYHLDSLSEPKKISPEGRLMAPLESWDHRKNPQSSESPVPIPSPLNFHSGLQGDPTGWKSQGACRKNSENLHPRLYRNRPESVPSGTETLLKGMQSQENVWVSADLVSPPSLLSVSTLESLEKFPKGTLSESKALQETKEQTENFWASESSAFSNNLPPVSVLESTRINPVGGLSKSDPAWKVTEHYGNSWAFQTPLLAYSSPPILVLESPRVRPMGTQFDSDRCEDIQRRNPFATDPHTSSSPQHPYARSFGLPDFEPILGDREQEEVCYVSMSQLCGLSALSNSMSNFHVGENPNYKLEGTTVEENWVPVPSPFSASLSNSKSNVQPRKFSQSPNPPIDNSLQSVPCSPIPEVLRIEPDQIGPPMRELLSGGKVEALPSQGEDGPEVPNLFGIQAWHWSKQMELRLQKLQQRPISRSPDSSQLGSTTALGSTLASWRLSSWSPQQTHPVKLCSPSPSCDPLQSQSTGTQYVQVSPSLSPSQDHMEGHGSAEKKPQIEEKMGGRTIAEMSSQEPVHKKAGNNHLGLEEPSKFAGPTSNKRKGKASALSLARERENSRKIIAGRNRGDSGLVSPKIGVKSHPTQVSAHRPSQRYSHRRYCCQHFVYLQELHSKAVGPQDQRGAHMEAGDILTPWHCKFCPRAHMEKHNSSTTQAAFTRGLQKVLAKFVGTHRPQCNSQAE